MYGLLLESLATFIKLHWGEAKWELIRRKAGVDSPSFSVHSVYSEDLIPRLTKCAVEELGVSQRQFYEAMGVSFVNFVSIYGYDQILKTLGRHMRDFLNGLDNLHEYLKFSYPKMQAPSFFCENETETGLTLHYRSRRKGFVTYTMGQIKQVSKRFYRTDCEIEVLSEKLDPETDQSHVIFHLRFDNRAFTEAKKRMTLIREEEQLPIRAMTIFELFPFCLVFCRDMIIRHTGQTLGTILSALDGKSITEIFSLYRPLIKFNFTSILERRNNVFEIVTIEHILDNGGSEDCSLLDEEDAKKHLRLKGQMLYMSEWKMMLFLATPVIQDLNALVSAGLYINDFSLHDCSRGLILAGLQQSVELKLALDQEQRKSRKLEESMRKLDEEMKRTDELLYQMIPKQVADRIRRGENPVETCQVFENVTILFADIVSFTHICSLITPMQVVSMLNHMYSIFDHLTEKNGVYKVETIGDSYLVVSGAPVKEDHASELIASMGLDMLDASKAIKDPSKFEERIQLRIGVHSGAVVAGVVGLKMPRYCLFGDVVNTASRMESMSEAGRIQISQTTKDQLPDTYITEYRGEIQMKGKGKMRTYWLNGRQGRVELEYKDFSWTEPKCFSPKREQSLDLDFDLEVKGSKNELHKLSPSTADILSGTAFAENFSRRFYEKRGSFAKPKEEKCYLGRIGGPKRSLSWGSSAGPPSNSQLKVSKGSPSLPHPHQVLKELSEEELSIISGIIPNFKEIFDPSRNSEVQEEEDGEEGVQISKILGLNLRISNLPDVGESSSGINISNKESKPNNVFQGFVCPYSNIRGGYVRGSESGSNSDGEMILRKKELNLMRKELGICPIVEDSEEVSGDESQRKKGVISHVCSLI